MCPEKSMDTLCELFGKTRQAYYQRMNYDYIEQSEDGIIVDMVMDIRQSMGKIGGRKLWHLLNEAYPGLIGRDRLYDLLERHNLKISKRKRAVRTTWSAAWMRRFDDLTKGLILTAANQLWVSDITYIRTIKGFLYLHLVTDAYSKKIMGWCLSENLNADHTINALRMAIRNAGCDLTGLIHHSDRGCQYCCERYVKLLQDKNISISMTQGGNPRDNAIAERVNGILKTEWLDAEHFLGLDDAYRRIARVIEIYNYQRPHLSLDYQTPAVVHNKTGVQKRRWKNYYKSENKDDINSKITEMTGEVFNFAQ